MATPPSDPSLLPLSRRRILVCRPQPEANRLVRAFEAQGADARAFPTLIRQDLKLEPAELAKIQNIDLYGHIAVVSAHAARRLLALMDQWWPQWPVGIHWYAIGNATAAVLRDAGLAVETPATGWTSEDLLNHPQLAHLTQSRVLVVKGLGGRPTLGDVLAARGAEVDTLSLYERLEPRYSAEDIRRNLGEFEPEAIVALSGETLNNLLRLGTDCSHRLQKAVIVVPAERVAGAARALGFSGICLPASLADKDVVGSLANYFASMTRPE